MGATVKFPRTRLELADIGGADLVRFPATFDEYWALLEEAEYRADYYQNEVIAMSYETDLHSDIVSECLHILKKIYPRSDRRFKVHDPNRPVYAGGSDKDEAGVFNPDGSVVSQPPVYFEYRPGMNAETTPISAVKKHMFLRSRHQTTLLQTDSVAQVHSIHRNGQTFRHGVRTPGPEPLDGHGIHTGKRRVFY